MPTLIDASILSVAITLGAEITLVLDVDSVADRKASNWRLRPTRALAVSEIPPDAAPAAPTAAKADEAKGFKIPETEISLEEVAKHNKKDDLWVAVKGIVMDLTNWVNEHPG